MLIISSLIFLVSILNFHLKILNQFNLIEGFIISLLSFTSLILSLNLIYKTNSKALNINNILSIFFIQIFTLSILFINGIIGNPNNEIKDFIYQPDIKKIIQDKQIYLIGGLEDKKLNLLKFYLPKYKVIENKQIHKIDQTMYGFISDKDMKQFNDSIRTEFDKQLPLLPNRIGVRNPKILSAIKIMEINIEDPLKPSEIALDLRISLRRLERLFQRFFKLSPKNYYMKIRLQKARQLLLQTEMNVLQIAMATGFTSSSHFSKCYKLEFNITPFKERGFSNKEL